MNDSKYFVLVNELYVIFHMIFCEILKINLISTSILNNS